MEKRYQVFISSTFVDLQEERKAVMQALLAYDCIPYGMELFPASNETQWSLIKRVIDQCDYYVLIIGGRYGSYDSEGIGYTEKEYLYAKEIGKPTISFLHKNPEKLPFDKSESDPSVRKKLEIFRNHVMEGLVAHWENLGELENKVLISMRNLIKEFPAVGWIRADKIQNSEKESTEHENAILKSQLVELQRKCDLLQLQLEKETTKTSSENESSIAQETRKDLQTQQEELSCNELKYSINQNKARQNDYAPIEVTIHIITNAMGITDHITSTYEEILKICAPIIMVATYEDYLKKFIGSELLKKHPERTEAYASNPNFHFNIIKECVIDDLDFSSIRLTFKALNWIILEHELDVMWTLSSKGEAKYLEILEIKK